MSRRRARTMATLANAGRSVAEASIDMAERLVPVYTDITVERALQDAQHGGREKDDALCAYQWALLVLKQMTSMAKELKGTRGEELNDLERVRCRMVKAAALAVACIEGIDRRFRAVDLLEGLERAASEDGVRVTHVAAVDSVDDLIALLNSMGIGVDDSEQHDANDAPTNRNTH